MSPKHPDVEQLARDVLELDGLRPAQRAALDELLAGRDTLVVLATGGGKSAIYQLGGLALGGLTLVVSPLVALQHDQLRGLSEREHDGHPVRSAQLNATLPAAERHETERALGAGELDFLLLSPEQLVREPVRELLTSSPRPVTLLAVDEAHLVSEWGFDFRPDYLALAEVRHLVGDPTVVALTATAPPQVQREVIERLDMHDPAVVVAGFDRPNITLAVHSWHGTKTSDKATADALVVDEVQGGELPALVYARTRKHTEKLAKALRDKGLEAAHYHAGLGGADRAEVQDAFLSNRLDVVVATSAFGMGIDKPDIRAVVHAGAPGSLDEYYQELGRAGRDGDPASAVLVYSPADLRLSKLFAAGSKVKGASVDKVLAVLARTEQEIPLADLAERAELGVRQAQRVLDRLADTGVVELHGDVVVPLHESGETSLAQASRDAREAERRRQAVQASRIEAMRHYAEATRCRRAELLGYFGEPYDAPCETCDNDDRVVLDEPEVESSGEHADLAGKPVRHKEFGTGTVLSVDEHELVVAFDEVGYKTLTPMVLELGLLAEA
ncbi:RecQ family ATP-dependent DNA helicase [Angustibacter aerolatus]